MAVKKRWIIVAGVIGLVWLGSDRDVSDNSSKDVSQTDAFSETIESNESAVANVPVDNSEAMDTAIVEDVPVETTVPIENNEVALDVVDQPEETSYYFDGTTLVTDEFTINITDVKVIAPGTEYNKYGDTATLAFWYTTTVHEDFVANEINPSSAWLFSFTALQDNDPNVINELNVGMLPDSAHSESQMQTIKPGGTVSNSVSYQLDDLQTPVKLTAVKNMFTGEEYGSQTYNLN